MTVTRLLLTGLLAGTLGASCHPPAVAEPAAVPSPTATPRRPEGGIVPNKSGAWTVKRDWTRQEVARYAQWISQIYEKKVSGTYKQRGAKLEKVLRDREMNLLLAERFAEDSNDPRTITDGALCVMKSASACGTFPILMFIYYCAVRGLPATFTRVDGDGGDIRYSAGNCPVSRFDPLSYKDLSSYVRALFFGSTNYTTGNWRTAPDLEGTDTVPVAVSLESTIPGLTLLYNSDGHGLVVGRVSVTGNVRLLDAHPDGSITSGQSLACLESVFRAVPEKNRSRWTPGWRMIRLAKCVIDTGGRIVGIRPFTNEEMRAYGYSDEQYTDVIAMRKGQPINIGGRPARIESYPDYVRKKLTTTSQIDPWAMIKEWAAQLQTLFFERALFVDEAWNDVLRSGPITLPDNQNIYQAEGRWEKWSSPSSDCDRKGAYFLVADQLEDVVRDCEPGQGNLVLTGFGRPIKTRRELAEAILAEKRRLFDATIVSYTTSLGKKVDLSLSEIEKRLFLMSFDPNHPPEVRWGAAPDSGEAAGCRKISTPLATGGSLAFADAYRREQRLRYRLSRKDGRTSFDDRENPTGPPKKLIDERLAPYLELDGRQRPVMPRAE